MSRAKPLTADEEAQLRVEAESEKDHPDVRHATWQRLVLRLLATIDHERANRVEQVRRKRVGHAVRQEPHHVPPDNSDDE